MLKPVDINDTQFDALVLRAPVPVLLECATPECIICKTMAERIAEASQGDPYVGPEVTRGAIVDAAAEVIEDEEEEGLEDAD